MKEKWHESKAKYEGKNGMKQNVKLKGEKQHETKGQIDREKQHETKAKQKGENGMKQKPDMKGKMA